MAAKYQILFNDIEGNACKVTFDFADWDGPVKDIEAAGDPVTISYNGEPDNLFQQVVTSKATLRLIAQEDFVRDSRDIDDREVSVTIVTPACKWIGYLIADERTELFDSGNYELELTCVDAFSYIKENANKILSNTDILSAQTLTTLVTAIVGLPCTLNIGYKPMSGGSAVNGNLFDLLYILVETFMDGGLLKSGIDIISEICDLFNCTSFVEDGVINFRQPRALIDSESKEIGCKDEGYADFLINDEQVYRTTGIVQLGVRHNYGDIGGNIVLNNFFYYYNGSRPIGSEFNHWQYRTDTDCTVTRELIQRENANGIFIKGLINTDNSNERVTTNWSYMNSSPFLYSISEFASIIAQMDPLLNSDYYLRLKYRYHRYALSRTTDPIKYAFRVFAVFSDGSKYTFGYDGDGGRDASHTLWSTNGTPTDLMPYISFPLDASNSESTFELKISCKAGKSFPVNKGDYQFMVVLYPMSPENTINQMSKDIIPDDINITEISIMPDIYTMQDLVINRDINPARNRIESALFATDETYCRSIGRFKTVNDPVEVVAGNKISEGVDTVVNNPNQYQLSGLNGMLMSSATRGNDYLTYQNAAGQIDKLVTLNAKDRMYFLRQPRNQITVDVRSSSLKFSDILNFPGFIEGKYVQMDSEYRVAECEHTITVQELKGADEGTDIIENFLSSE